MKVLTHRQAAKMVLDGIAQGNFSYYTADKKGYPFRNTWNVFSVDDKRSHFRVAA